MPARRAPDAADPACDLPERAAEIQWRDGSVPVSARFGDTYFSREGGLAESRHTFLAGNDLPARFRPGFRIAELGFGTGLNALAAVHLWQASGQRTALRFTSFEAFPIAAADMARALAAFPDLAGLAANLTARWAAGARLIELPGASIEVIEGDAQGSLPRWTGRADAWLLDGFAPARNPDMWAPALIAEVARHTAPGGTAATYSAAGGVRRALAAAGFEVARVPGFGRKRHMTRARLTAAA